MDEGMKAAAGLRTKASSYNIDGWGSFFSGWQERQANKQNMVYNADILVSDAQLTSLWLGDGFSSRVISCIADDMTKKGFRVTGDLMEECMTELARLNVDDSLNFALCMSMLYGGAAILLGISDGRSLDKPVALNSISGIGTLRVYSRLNCVPDTTSIDKNPSSPHFGKPAYYYITDTRVFDTRQKVHRDRLLIIPWEQSIGDGATVASTASAYDQWWGSSIIRRMYRELSNLGIYESSISNLIQESVVGKYSLSHVAEMLASGNESKLVTRLQLIQMSKSIINAIILDKDNDETYTRDALSFAGLSDMGNVLMILLSSVSGIPVTRLFGRSPAGLNATGKSDMDTYYDMIASYQRSTLGAEVQKLVFYVNKYIDSIRIEDKKKARNRQKVGGRPAAAEQLKPITTQDEISIVWNSLYQMTEKEQADVYFTNAQADVQYYTMGVLGASEMRVNRFLNGYKPFMSVETSEVPSDTGREAANEAGSSLEKASSKGAARETKPEEPDTEKKGDI